MSSSPEPRQDFSHERLRRLLSAGRDVFWRHDVDADPQAAVQMAQLEQEVGVRATYYLMLRSPYYNIFCPEGRWAVSALLAAGQRLGVHCDLGADRDAALTDRDLRLPVLKDYATLHREYPAIKRTVSFHCPPHDVLWRDVPGFESAYAPHWRDRYISDSRGEFRVEPESRIGDCVQINLHPEHWFCRDGDFLGARAERLQSAYEPFFGEKLAA